MEQKIVVKHINGLKSARAKFSDVGDLSHELTFDVLLAPGDLERLLMLFQQRIPVSMEISSSQSRMDFQVVMITEPKSNDFSISFVPGDESLVTGPRIEEEKPKRSKVKV